MAGSDNESDDASVHSEATIAQQQQNIQPQIITTVSNNNAKFPYLKKDEYERTGRDRDGRVIILPPTIADEHIAVQRESKERTTLLQSIPDDHVADFHYMDDTIIESPHEVVFPVSNNERKIMRKLMMRISQWRLLTRKKQDQIKITGRTRLCRLFDEDSSDLEKDLYEEASEEDLDEEDSDLDEEDSDQEEELDEEDIDQEEDLDEEDSDQEDSDDGWD
ncbi:hypothetical protein Tco_0133316 [Tanacetum coccineum]